MKERPIILTGPEVQGIMAGARTQIRQVIRANGPDGHPGRGPLPTLVHQSPLPAGSREHRRMPSPVQRWVEPGGWITEPAVGDRLWVRETWCLAHPDYHTEEEGERLGRPIHDGRWCHYAASDDVDFNDNKSPWRSPVAMPRWASRLTLEITEVRVQRLRAVTEEDARAEGYRGSMADAGRRSLARRPPPTTLESRR